MTAGVFGIPRIIELNGQKPPLTYKRFQAIISRMELPRKPVGSVTSQQMEGCRAEIQESHDETYGVPSLEELGAYSCPSPSYCHLLFRLKKKKNSLLFFFLFRQSDACYCGHFRK